VQHLNLLPHPEGGWYSEVYRSEEILQLVSLPQRYSSEHCFSTSIYFLLEKDDFSAFHRITSDETWHFYLGSPVVLYTIDTDGSVNSVILGNDFSKGQQLQFTIRRNKWFAASCTKEDDYSLVGCTVAPGFDYSDFELGKRNELLKMYPQHTQLISEYTRI